MSFGACASGSLTAPWIAHPSPLLFLNLAPTRAVKRTAENRPDKTVNVIATNGSSKLCSTGEPHALHDEMELSLPTVRSSIEVPELGGINTAQAWSG